MQYIQTNSSSVVRVLDGAEIPCDPANTDYAEYLAWLAAGNAPAPYVEPDPTPEQISAQQKLSGIEFEGVMCSATKDDQNGLVAVLTAYQLQGTAFKPTRYDFSNGNSLVITKNNIQQFIAVWLPFRQGFFAPVEQ